MEAISQLIPGNWIYALGWTVVHSLWQGALLAIFLAAFRWFAVRSGPQLRYVAGMLALCTLFGLSVLTFSLLLETGVSGEGVVITLRGHADPVAPDYLARLTEFLNRQLPLLVAAWLLGMLFFAARTAGGFWYVSRLRRSGHVPVEEFWQQRAGQMASQMKIGRAVRILESVHVNIPLVIGHFKPLVLLPVGLVNQLSPTEVEAILAHELAHIRRHDFLLNLVQSLLDIIYYFNPAAWYISATVRTERENCCDDWAVVVCGSSLAYVHALVQLQERAVNMPQLALSMAAGGKPLLNRVRRILNQPNNKKTVMERFIATLLLLAAVAVFSISAGQPDENKAPADELRPVLVSQQNNLDSIPPVVKEEVQIIKEKGDRKMELTMKNGEVKEFKVDGKVVPEEEQGAYRADIQAMQEALPEPPGPVFAPDAPQPPDAPQGPDGIAPPPPPPPAPMPPRAPRAPKVERDMRVSTRTLENGKILIRVDEPGKEPIEIVVDGKDVVVSGTPVGEDPQIFLFPPENGYLVMPELQRMEAELRMLDAPDWKQAQEEHRRALEEHGRAMDKQSRELAREMEMMEMERAAEMQNHQQLLHDLQREFPKIAVPEPGAFILRDELPGHEGNSLKAAIERELRRDGYIEQGGSYEFELSGKKLLINGKKESDVIFEKYRKIYEKHTGVNLSKDSRFEIEE